MPSPTTSSPSLKQEFLKYEKTLSKMSQSTEKKVFVRSGMAGKVVSYYLWFITYIFLLTFVSSFDDTIFFHPEISLEKLPFVLHAAKGYFFHIFLLPCPFRIHDYLQI